MVFWWSSGGRLGCGRQGRRGALALFGGSWLSLHIYAHTHALVYCVNMYTHMCIHIYICMYVYIYIFIFIFIFIHIYLHMYTHTHMRQTEKHLYIYIYVHTCVYIYIYTRTFGSSCVESDYAVKSRPLKISWVSSAGMQSSLVCLVQEWQRQTLPRHLELPPGMSQVERCVSPAQNSHDALLLLQRFRV